MGRLTKMKSNLKAHLADLREVSPPIQDRMILLSGH